MHIEQRDLILQLSLINGIGPATIATILAHKPADIDWVDVCNYTSSDIQHTFGLSKISAERIVNGLKNTDLLEQEKVLAEQHALHIITWLDENYPSMLRTMYLPPPVLYWKGDVAKKRLEKCIAVIGSRAAHSYAKQVMMQLIPPLVLHNWVIVSGGALGADSMAHRITLDNAGITIAILGSGLLKPYPKQNQSLFDAIIEHGGSLVSPFPLMMQALPGNFPARNRIIAGLSKGCVVVQAAAKSGTRITAQYALNQGSEVFAVPGPINDPLSAGCHALIQEGAHLVHSVSDILSAFGHTAIVANATTHIPNANASTPETDQATDAFDQPPAGQDLYADIKQLCIRPCSIDDLLHHTQKPLEELHTILLNMQLEGIMYQNFAGMWVVS